MIDSPSAEYQKRPPDGISHEQSLAAVEKVFHGLLCRLHDFRELIEVVLGQTEPRGPLLHLLVPSLSFQGLLCPKKYQNVSWHLDFVWY